MARDKAIEKLLAAKLRAAAQDRDATRGEACLDAETLAAYVERALAPCERLACETHLAACRRCQEQVTELVRLSEAEEPAAQKVAAARILGVGLRTTWFRWAWAAPAVAAVVVAGLFWYARAPRRLSPPSGEAALKMPRPAQLAPAVPAASLPPAVAENKPVPPAPRTLTPARKPSKELSKLTSSTGPANGKTLMTTHNLTRAESGAQPFAPARAPAAAPAGGASIGAIATPSDRALLATGEAGGVAAAPSAAPQEAMTPSRAPAPVAPAATQAATQQVTVTAQAEMEQKVKRSDTGRGKACKEMPAAGLLALQSVPVSGSRQWRVGVHGLIEKPALDDSWEAVPSGVTEDLNTIVFATPAIGWVVGQAGTVLRSVDGGATWQKIPIPTSEDLLHVTATSDQAAGVTTRRGQTFSTANGGKSWKTVPR